MAKLITEIAVCRNCRSWLEIKDFVSFKKRYAKDELGVVWLDNNMRCCKKPDWRWETKPDPVLKKRLKLPPMRELRKKG